jgi:hypothetical protein
MLLFARSIQDMRTWSQWPPGEKQYCKRSRCAAAVMVSVVVRVVAPDPMVWVDV